MKISDKVSVPADYNLHCCGPQVVCRPAIPANNNNSIVDLTLQDTNDVRSSLAYSTDVTGHVQMLREVAILRAMCAFKASLGTTDELIRLALLFQNTPDLSVSGATLRHVSQTLRTGLIYHTDGGNNLVCAIDEFTELLPSTMNAVMDMFMGK